MRRLLQIFLASLLGLFSASGLTTLHTNTVNLTLANVADGTFNDFKFQLSGYDDQVFNFNYDLALTGIAASFRITKPIEGTIYLDVPVTSVTVSGTNATFTIARTNIPPPGNYYGELLSYEAVSTNYYRTIAQGKLPITWSLYLNETNYFQRTTTNAGVGQVYVHPNWIDPPWIGTNSGLGSIYPTLAMFTTLSNYTDTIQTNSFTRVSWGTSLASRITSGDTNLWHAASTNVTMWLTNTWPTSVASRIIVSDTNSWHQAVTSAAQGAQAFTWGDHALAGYLSTATNRFAEVLIGRPALTGTNICGLTGVYTGIVAASGIAFTSTAPIVAGPLYVAGFTKQNANGSVTMSVGGIVVRATAASTVTNWFSTPSATLTNVILSIYGDGSSKSDVSNVYVRAITNGSGYFADDIYVGDRIFSTNPIAYITDLTIVSNEVDVLQTNSLTLVSWGTSVAAQITSGDTSSWQIATTSSPTLIAFNNTNAGFDGRIAIVETNALLLTGSRAMQGNLNAGGFSVTNVASNSLAFNDGVSLTSTKVLLYDTLDDSTNALNTRIASAETATNALNTRAANLDTATNALNTRAGNLEGATNALNTRAGSLETATNALNTRAGNLEGATNWLNTSKADTNEIMAANGVVYALTNTPTAGHVLKFNPANSTAYFAAETGGAATNFGITSSDAARGDWHNAVSSRVDVLQTGALWRTGGTLSGAITGTALDVDSIVLGTNTSVTNWPGADNLGNHTATQILNMAASSISNVARIDFQTEGFAIGSNATVGALSEIAIGYSAWAALDAVGIGYKAISFGDSVAYGSLAYASNYSVAIGYGADSGGNNGVALGHQALANGDCVAIGYGITNAVSGSTKLYGKLLMSDHIDMGGNLITNTGSPKIYATGVTFIVTGSGVPTAVPFGVTVASVGGTWDGSNWTPGVIGWVSLDAAGKMTILDSGTFPVTRWYKNNVKMKESHNRADSLFWGSSFQDYNQNTTNKYHVLAFPSSGYGWTNDTTVTAYFSGFVLP